MNPWVTIWTQPRATIRHIVETNPKKSFFWLASICSLQSLLFLANYISLGLSYHYFLIILLCVVFSPILGGIWIYFYGWLFYITGKWLGGTAHPIEVRAAFAWSRVPLLINLCMWIVLLIFTAGHAFIQYQSLATLIFMSVVAFVSGIWSLILLIQCLKEVHNFSLGFALGNTFLGYGIGFLVIFVITFLLRLFIK